jgi:hypothetical protein
MLADAEHAGRRGGKLLLHRAAQAVAPLATPTPERARAGMRRAASLEPAVASPIAAHGAPAARPRAAGTGAAAGAPPARPAPPCHHA